MAMADGPLQVAVAGGSIGGLCSGLALQRIAGAEVDIYERHVGEVETRGAGIVVQPELTQLLRLVDAAELPTTGCEVRRYLEPDGGEGSEQVMPQRFTSWEAIFQTLRGAFPDGRYHVGAALGAFDTVDCRIKAEIAGRGLITADLLVCADGAQSPTRRLLLPDATSDYAGYVAWRGTLDEAVAPAELARFFDDTFTFSEARSGGHILVYYIPGASADSTRGKRRLNWVWYVGADDADLERWLTGRDGQRHHNSLPLGGASEDVLAEIRARALGEVHPRLAELVAATPEPFLQTIVDIGVSRTVFGRACLLGDAAFVVRPHTAAAAAKAASDAMSLATAIHRAGRNVDAALAGWQASQIERGQELLQYGVALGQRWAKAR